MVWMNFVDLGQEFKVRVTFEAENNLDFRLGTGPLRYTGLAQTGDIAAITRVRETQYELRLFRQNNRIARKLVPHAVNLIGHQDKKYGFISNQKFKNVIRKGRRIP